MPDIAVRDLTLAYGDNTILHGVSFDVAPGEFVTLLGPSGCGKTTTLMSIAGLTTPDSGSISTGDTDLFNSDLRINRPPERRNSGVVFQSYAVWPHMDVAGNVAYPLRIRRTPKAEIAARVRETLELVGLQDLASRYPHELSGGQQQRIAIARAIIYSPKVLLLDEPLSNLDAKLRERARVWLKEIQSRLGLTTIFVTHDQDEALAMSDRIVVMNDGRIEQIGTPEEIYRRPASPFVASFLGSSNLIDATLTTGQDGTSSARIGATGDTITVAHGEGIRGEVELMLRPEDITLESEASGQNSVPVRVLSRAFLGSHYRLIVDHAGQQIHVDTRRPIIGDQAYIHISPDDVRVFERLPEPDPSLNTNPKEITHV